MGKFGSVWLFAIGVIIIGYGFYRLSLLGFPYYVMPSPEYPEIFGIMLVGLTVSGIGSVYGRRKIQAERLKAMKKEKAEKTSGKPQEKTEPIMTEAQKTSEAQKEGEERMEAEKAEAGVSKEGKEEESAGLYPRSLETKDKKVIICPKCGEKNLQKARYCDECGTMLAKKCSACGEENKLSAKFCDECGEKI